MSHSNVRRLPIGQFSPDDVFVVAYPKSGSTWFQNLTAGILFDLDPEETPDTLIQERVPDVHYQESYERTSEPMVFKSHDRPRPDYRRVVYLLRDGRDVAVSHLHHRAAMQSIAFTDEQILAIVREDAKQWQEHVNAWQENPHSARMITIRYEDLLTDTPRELRRFCDFLSLKRDDQFLQNLAQQTSFEKMRAKERRFGWNNPAWPKDKAFIRRGIAGSYRDEMPEHLLSAFTEIAGATLRRCGYL